MHDTRASLLKKCKAEPSQAQVIAFCTRYICEKIAQHLGSGGAAAAVAGGPAQDVVGKKIASLNSAVKNDRRILHALQFACCWMTRDFDASVLDDKSDITLRLGVVGFLATFVMQERASHPSSDENIVVNLSAVEERIPSMCDLFALARFQTGLPLTVAHHRALYETTMPLREVDLLAIMRASQFQQEFKLSLFVKYLKQREAGPDVAESFNKVVQQLKLDKGESIAPFADIFALTKVRMGMPISKADIEGLDEQALTIRMLQSDALSLFREPSLDEADKFAVLDAFLQHRDERDTLEPHAKLSKLQIAMDKVSPKASQHYFALCRLSHDFPISRSDVLAATEFASGHPNNIPAYVTQRYLYSRGSSTEAKRKLVTLICLADRAGIKHVDIVNTFAHVLDKEGFLSKMDVAGQPAGKSAVQAVTPASTQPSRRQSTIPSMSSPPQIQPLNLSDSRRGSLSVVGGPVNDAQPPTLAAQPQAKAKPTMPDAHQYAFSDSDSEAEFFEITKGNKA